MYLNNRLRMRSIRTAGFLFEGIFSLEFCGLRWDLGYLVDDSLGLCTMDVLSDIAFTIFPHSFGIRAT